MRSRIVVLVAGLAGIAGLAACESGTVDVVSCPLRLADGDPCAFAGRCWHENGFSSCESEWCACRGGRVACEGISADTGQSCGDDPITSCSYEGNPDCDTPPTAQWCNCANGTWTCGCACYGGATCFVDACSLPPDVIRGAACADHDAVCTYSSTTCRCQPGPFEEWTFACS